MVRAGADFSPITKQAQKASASMKQMSTSVAASTGMIRKALGAIGIAVSLGAVIAAAKDAKAAYDKQAEAEAKLAQVMHNTMDATSDEVKEIKELCAAQQELGVIGDEVQLAGAQELATYLEKTSTLKKLIPVMNDMVAQQYGYNASAESATNIATMLGKVMDGQVGALSRYGYKFDEAQAQILKFGTEEERAATLAEVVGSSVGGMNQALAMTPTGRLQQLSNTLGDIKEQFGQAVSTVATAFLPLLNRLANMLASIAAIATRVAQAIANVFGKKLSTSTGTVANGAGAASEALDDMAESAGGAGKAAEKAAKSVMGFDELNKLSDNSAASSGGSGTGGGAGAGGGGSSISDLFNEEEATESLGWLERALQRVRDLVASLNFEKLKSAWESLSESAKHLGEVIGEYLGWAFDNILTPLAHWTVEQALPAGIKLVSSVLELLANVLERLKPLFTWVWDNVLSPIAEWTGEVFIQALEWITEKIQAISDLISGKTSLKEFLDNLTLGETLLGSFAAAVGVVAAGLAVAAGIINTLVTVVSAARTAALLFKAAIALLTSPLGLVTLAIAAVIAIGVLLYKNWDTIKEKLDTLVTKMKEGWERIKTSVTQAWEEIKEKAIAYFGPLFEDIQRIWQGIKDVFQGVIDFVVGIFTGDWARAWDGVAGIFVGAFEIVDGAISAFFDWCSGLISAIADAISWLKGLLEGLNTVANSNATRIEADGSIYLQGFASGGFPDAGQLFVARESGPEMVGTLNGHTAVADNQEITEGIAIAVEDANEGVINALYAVSAQIIQAMGENSRGGSIDWATAAKQITRYQKQAARAGGI